MGNDLATGIAMLIGACFAVAIAILYLWSIIWAAGDAESRGKSGCLVGLLVAFFSWPLGLLIWLIFRPDHAELPQPLRRDTDD